MLLGCCHCGETPSESTPPSQSLPPSTSQSLPPSDSASGPDYSVIGSGCISSFGCAAIPRRLTWNITVSGGSWDGNIDCLCPSYNGMFTLKFCDCTFSALLGYRLFYATDDLGKWRGRAGFPSTDLVGCRDKTSGSCTPVEGGLTGSRRYYAVVTTTNIRVFTTTYYSARDTFPFPTSNITRQWTYTGSPNCLASASYSLPQSSTILSGFDGCGWGTGTLTPG
jgi:hypothetical protein